MLQVLQLMEPMEWLTVGLVLFAGVQVLVQVRAEQQRRSERILDREEAIDRAFHYIWAEHFRLDGLADELDRRDLVEMACLGVLDASEVLPRDWSHLTESMASLSREAGFLGGVALGLCYNVKRSIAILESSVQAFSESGPTELSAPKKVQWLHQTYDKDLETWVTAVRTGVREMANLVWDVATHNPKGNESRQLTFSDDLRSEFAKAAVRGLQRRSGEAPS